MSPRPKGSRNKPKDTDEDIAFVTDEDITSEEETNEKETGPTEKKEVPEDEKSLLSEPIFLPE